MACGDEAMAFAIPAQTGGTEHRLRADAGSVLA